MVNTDYGCEINATRHCNLRCAQCNHGSAFADVYYMPVEVLKEDLQVMKNHLRTKLLLVQGGDPLIHPDVVELLRLCIESGIAKQSGLLTNGKLLKRMGDDLWALLRDGHCELRMSCYPGLDPDIVPWIQRKADEWGFYVRPQEINSFKPVFASVPDGSTYHGCGWNRCLTIHSGYFYLCPLSAFWPEQYMKRAERWKDIDPHVDGIPIPGMTDDKLQEFLNRRHPLESCKICSGGRGPDVPHHQNKNKEEWEKEAGVKEALA